MKRAFLILTTMVLAASAATAATVTLARSATLAEGPVTLGDVAEVSNCPAGLRKLVEDVVLGQSPARAQVLRLTYQDVRERLFASGLNVTEIVLAGSSVVEVRRRDAQRPAAAKDGALAGRVRDAVLDAAAKELNRPREELGVAGLKFEAFGIPDAAQVTLTPIGALRLSDEVRFEAKATVGGEEAGRFEVTARLTGLRKVVVARRMLSAGMTPGAEDLEVKAVDSASAPQTAFEEAAGVVGRRLARRINAGQAVTTDDLAKCIQVKSGEICSTVVRGKGFHVVTEARSREQGALGEEIRMESLKLRRPFTAVVTGLRSVEVRTSKEVE
jgi:flagella basal body P-ring formation protein FlgA